MVEDRDRVKKRDRDRLYLQYQEEIDGERKGVLYTENTPPCAVCRGVPCNR